MKKRLGDIGYPLLILCCAICFSLGGVMVKLVPWEGIAISSGRSIIGAAVLAVYMKLRRHKFVFNRSVFIGGCAIGLSGTTYIIANKLTTAANAVVIQYTAPVFIIFYMWLFWREAPKKLDIAATFLIFGGILLMFTDSLGGGKLAGDLVALLSGAIYAGVFLMKKMEGADNLSSVLVGCIIAAVIGLPWLVRESDFSPSVMGAIFIIGAVQFAGGYIFMAEGLMGTPPLTASLISMVEPVINPVLASIFLHEGLSPIAIVGIILVIGTVAVYTVLKDSDKILKKL